MLCIPEVQAADGMCRPLYYFCLNRCCCYSSFPLFRNCFVRMPEHYSVLRSSEHCSVRMRGCCSEFRLANRPPAYIRNCRSVPRNSEHCSVRMRNSVPVHRCSDKRSACNRRYSEHTASDNRSGRMSDSEPAYRLVHRFPACIRCRSAHLTVRMPESDIRFRQMHSCFRNSDIRTADKLCSYQRWLRNSV